MAKNKKNGNEKVLKNLKDLMKETGRKFSIRVGIIGDKAYEKHPDTDLTNAQLGAVHEFGASININHPGGQPYIFLENGQTRFVSKSSEAGQKAIKAGRITKPHQIQINMPERSFLRMPILGPDGKKEIMKNTKNIIGNNLTKSDLNNKLLNKFVEETVHAVAETAYLRVLNAFETNGYGNWKPTSQIAKQHRKYNPNNPTLVDEGTLKKSISYEIKELN